MDFLKDSYKQSQYPNIYTFSNPEIKSKNNNFKENKNIKREENVKFFPIDNALIQKIIYEFNSYLLPCNSGIYI